MSSETCGAHGVGADQVDHEVQSVGSADFARFAVRRIGLDELGVGEVRESIDRLRVAVLQQEHSAQSVLRPRGQEWLAHATIISPPSSVRQQEFRN